MRKLALLPVLVLALILGACGDSSTGPDNSFVGTYQLKSAGGAPIPATVAQVGVERLEITGGSVTLNADQTFSTSVGIRYTNGSSVTNDTVRNTGTYVKNNNAIQLNYSDGTQDAASLSGRTLTLTSQGTVFVFER